MHMHYAATIYSLYVVYLLGKLEISIIMKMCCYFIEKEGKCALLVL